MHGINIRDKFNFHQQFPILTSYHQQTYYFDSMFNCIPERTKNLSHNTSMQQSNSALKCFPTYIVLSSKAIIRTVSSVDLSKFYSDMYAFLNLT
jgi:hypothetical protein